MKTSRDHPRAAVAPFLEGQWIHAACLALLLAGLAAVARLDAVRTGELLGLSTPGWIWLAVAAPVAHQVYVWLAWRAQLHFGLLTRLLGRTAFPAYMAGFALFGTVRLVTLWALAAANRGTVPLPPAAAGALAVLAAIPALYLMVSVRRYFGFRRAAGIDHFDPAYRQLPMVREGIFRWTPNAMYVFGFLVLWAIALAYASAAALAVSAFSHAHIWVHYHATEKPDMRRIYGDPADRRGGEAA